MMCTKISQEDEQLNDWMDTLADWYTTPLGEAVIQAIDEQLADCLPNIWGNYFLQSGSVAQQQWLRHSAISRKFTISPQTVRHCPSVCASELQLPLLDSSLDLLFSPLQLESYPDVSTILAEYDRVLRAGGHLLICGINPVSFWGLPQLFVKSSHPCPFFQGHLHTANSIRRRLSQLGYQLDFLRSFFYRPPVSSKRCLSKTEFFEHMGKMLWPFPAGFYLLLMQKRVAAPMSVKPLWQFREYVIGKEFA